MSKKWNVVIAEDHPLVAEAYQKVLIELSLEFGNEIKFTLYNDLDEVNSNLGKGNYFTDLDLILLDIRLPGGENGNIISGEDLGIAVRSRSLHTKIIVSTSFSDGYRIHSILQSVKPDGFLVKSDMTHKELEEAVRAVLLNDTPYFSKTVLQIMRKQIHQDFMLDNLDRKFLYEMSMGTKMKELPDILNLSMGGVERRKRKIRLLFDPEDKGDRELIKVAKEKGFI